ncbi:MAG TPA: hypothetical protein VI911_11605 [Patescibacteria group bacterium]|nr:hypothetical protein [Patescibacteria group bacterium]
MPYIKQDDRLKFDKALLEIFKNTPKNAGELNYLITSICYMFIERDVAKYQDFNDAIGALEGAKLEMYRRIISPYEDKKIEQNGDV